MSFKYGKYPAREHARRVARALAVHDGLVVLNGRQSTTFDDSDMPPVFRQRRYFYYMSGSEDADCYVTFDVRSDRLTLWVPPQRTVREILYMGPVVTPESAVKKYDIDKALFAEDLDDYVERYLKSGSTIYLLGHGDASRFSSERFSNLDSGPPSLDFHSLKLAMNACRVIKDDWEIAAIREANRITTLAHIEVLKNITKLHNESGVEGIYVGTCIAAGAKTQSYSPICAAGQNAATLHYIANRSPLHSDQLLLIDAGAEYRCYASDVTRTFPISPSSLGYPSREAEEIYLLVEDMQESCIRRVRPGMPYRDLNVLAHCILVQGLLKLGILHNGTFEDILHSGTSSAFLPHGLGHHLGLEVHDVEDLPRPMLHAFDHSDARHRADASPFVDQNLYDLLLSNSSTYAALCRSSEGLRAGMVVTIEPGIYFNKFGLEEIYLKQDPYRKYINVKKLKQYMHVGGVRIEDDILVTEDGYENLTTTPKGDDAIRIIRHGAAK